MSKSPFENGSLFLAPMEGVTDISYRNTIEKLYPGDWDFLATDFLRIPTTHKYSTKHMLKHFGSEAYNNSNILDKTIFQILVSDNSPSAETAIDIERMGFKWLDINVGCPSKQVVKNHGGSYLLKDLPVLKKIVKDIRENFTGTFTAKIRTGFENSNDFEKILKTLEDEGVDAITVHGRTREELYKGKANWSLIKKAVDFTNIPIIGNGDVWSVTDIHEMFDYTGCSGIMIARGALKAPWMAGDYKTHKYQLDDIERFIRIQEFFTEYKFQLENNFKMNENAILRRFKGIIRYMLDDRDGLELLRTQTLDRFSLQLNKKRHH